MDRFSSFNVGFIHEHSRLHVVEIASCRRELNDHDVAVVRLGAKVVGWCVEYRKFVDNYKAPEVDSIAVYQADSGERENSKIGYFDLDTKLFHSIVESPEFNLPVDLVYDHDTWSTAGVDLLDMGISEQNIFKW